MARKRDGLYRRGNIFVFRYKDEGVWREKQLDNVIARKLKIFALTS